MGTAHTSRGFHRGPWARVIAAAAVLAVAGAAQAQAPTADQEPLEQVTGPLAEFADRKVGAIVLRRPTDSGAFAPLEPTLETMARQQIRTAAGSALDPQMLLRDRRTLDRLGRFRRIVVEAVPQDDGSVVVVFTLDPQPLIYVVQPVGNRALSDQKISVLTEVLVLNPVDPVLIQNVARDIERAYALEGYTEAQVTPDLSEVDETGQLFLRVREGSRLRVTGVRFEGNEVFSDRQLRSQVELKTYKPVLEKGRFDETEAEADVQSLIQFYRDRGYIDVRAGWQRIDAPNNREVIVVYHVAEGERYTVRDVIVEYADEQFQDGFVPRLSPEQVRGLMSIKTGDVYNASLIRRSVEDIYAALTRMGYTTCTVQTEDLTDAEENLVDLRVRIGQGPASRVGLVNVIGNTITQLRVVMRYVELQPDTPADIHERVLVEDSAGQRTQEQLEQTRFFGPLGRPDVRVVLQDPVGDTNHRDILISLEEARTANFAIGAALSSDSGVIGQLIISESNFDITDWPESWDEFIGRRSFRGGGQRASISVEPGNISERYQVSFGEPQLFEGDYSLDTSAFYRSFEYTDYDESRVGGTLALGRAFGSQWRAGLSTRLEQVRVRDIEPDRPVDLFESEGESMLDVLGLTLSRSSFDRPFLPTRGSAVRLSIEQAGLLTDDWDFTRLRGSGVVYVPIQEDFLGRATVANFTGRVGYIPDAPSDVPVFERLNSGGSNFRGFGVRGIGPVGIRNDTGMLGDDQIGGTWELFVGAEIQQPIFNDNFRLVFFTDMGTITTRPGFDHWRMSVGTGLRMTVPALTPVPLAFDFGFPVLKEPTDDTRIFTFTVEVPF
ncbi:MAG: outer membrane protein assembly factor BamA [Phycisphaerales bacterium]